MASKTFATRCFPLITGNTKLQTKQLAECLQQTSPTVSTLVNDLSN